MYILLYFKWITNKDIMYNTECHSLLCDNLKKEFEKGYMYMYN